MNEPEFLRECILEGDRDSLRTVVQGRKSFLHFHFGGIHSRLDELILAPSNLQLIM
jgi:hypothetical protein